MNLEERINNRIEELEIIHAETRESFYASTSCSEMEDLSLELTILESGIKELKNLLN